MEVGRDPAATASAAGEQWLDRRAYGWFLAGFGMLLVSTDSVFLRWSGTDAVNMSWLVSVFSLPMCIALGIGFELQRWRESARHHWLVVVLLAALFAVTQLSFFAAISYTYISNVVAIIAAGPVFVALGATLFLSEPTSAKVWFAIALTVVGIGLIVGPSVGHAQVLGNLFALFTIVCFSISLLVFRRHPTVSRFLVFSLCAVLTLIVLSPWVDPWQQPASAWFCAAAMGLVFNTGGRVIYAHAPRYAPSSEVALFNPVETVAATLWGWWLFAEVPTSQTLFGAAIVLLGVFYGTLSKKPTAVRVC